MSERKLFSQYAQSTLEREDREQARRLNARGMHVLEIAKLFGVSRTTIRTAINNRARDYADGSVSDTNACANPAPGAEGAQVKKKQYPQVKYAGTGRARFYFREGAGLREIQMVTAGKRSYDGVLFEGLVGIKWDDWDELVKFVKSQRRRARDEGEK